MTIFSRLLSLKNWIKMPNLTFFEKFFAFIKKQKTLFNFLLLNIDTCKFQGFANKSDIKIGSESSHFGFTNSLNNNY